MDIKLREFISQQASYVYNPVKWAHDLVKFEMDTWQQDAANAFVQKKFSAWSTGSGVGKSALLAIMVLHFLSTRPFPRVPCTAPSQHQLYDVLWAEISKWLRRSDMLAGMFKWTATRISLRGHEEEWYAVARTARSRPGDTTTEGLQGFHGENILFVIDEASGVPDQTMGAVDGALTTPGAYAILASNPTRRSGYFYKIITDERQREWWDVRFVNAETASHVDPDSVRRAERIWGKDSDYYRVKVLGLPPRAEADALITPEQVFAAHTRQQVTEGQVVLSCDPARFGDDSTIFLVRKGNTFVKRHSFKGMDIAQITKIGIDLFYEYNVDVYNIDEIGLGAGVVDTTKKFLPKDKPKIHGVNVGEAAFDPEKYYNKRAELFWHLRTFINNTSIAFDSDFLDEELTSIKYGWDQKDAKIKLQSKDDIKKEIGRSPNDADAFALSFAHEIDPFGLMNFSRKYFNIGQQQPEENKDLKLEEVGARSLYKSGVGSMRYSNFSNFGEDRDTFGVL